MNAEPNVAVKVSRRFSAPAARVFDAFVTPADIARWMGAPAPAEGGKIEADPRAGGVFLFVAKRQGTDVAHFGEYREVIRPTRLVFTWAVLEAPPEPTVVSIDIVEVGDKCDVTLTHTGVPTPCETATQQGWTTILQTVAVIVEG